MSQARQTRHFEGGARVALRAKCRVCLAWLAHKAPVMQASLLSLISTQIPQQKEKKEKTRRARGKKRRGIEW